MTKSKTTKRALLSSCVALMLCFSMLLGTTYAWFTDSVTSQNNIIQSGVLDATLEYMGKDDTEYADASKGAIFNYQYWEPGYTDAKLVKIGNAGNLAFRYQLNIIPNFHVAEGKANLADVIDVYFIPGNEIPDNFDCEDPAMDVYKVGTLSELMADPDGAAYGYMLPKEGVGTKNVKAPAGVDIDSLPKGAVEACLLLHMQETANNDYQNLSVGDGFSVQLLATQMTYEEDSFDNMYDEDAKYDAAPVAKVTKLGAIEINATEGIGGEAKVMTLDAAFQFEPTETQEEGEASPYRWWHADFAVSSDKEIPGDSVALAGYYKAWCQYNNDNWVAMTTSDTIPANTEIRLVEALDAEVAYKELCEYGNDGTGFQCGIAALDAEAVAGATITVELRLYEVENADSDSGSHNIEVIPENYVTIGTYSYTFPAIKVANNDELDAAIKDGVAAVELGSGTYIIPDSAKGKTLTIVGNGDTVIATQDDGSYEGCDYSLDGSTVTFENVTINTDSSTYTGYARLNATYNNCTINGTYTLYGDSEFNNCTFNVSGDVYNIWTWGAPNATFNKCTFNSDGKAMLLYGTVNTKLTLNDCVFNDNGGLTDLKAAVEIGNDYGKSYELIVNNTTVHGYAINDKGINTGTTLWGNKNSMGTDKLNVVVDGVDVY